MGNILAVDLVDIARSLGDHFDRTDPAGIAEWLLREYVLKKGGHFNHNTSIACLPPLFSGVMTKDKAKAVCSTTGAPGGRVENRRIIEAVAPYCLDHPSTCYTHPFVAVAIGRHKNKTIFAKVKAPLTRVENGEAFIVLPLFRKRFVASSHQIDGIMSFVRAQWAYGDFSAADVEGLVAKGMDGCKTRYLSVKRGASRSLLSIAELENRLHSYVEAVAFLIDQGWAEKHPDLQGYRIIDPDHPTFL